MDQSSVIIEVKQGKLRGFMKTSILAGKKYFSFRGIPYAKPPIGDLRFRPPVPVENWDVILEANNDKNICIQSKQLKEYNKDPQGSEDCLYLNVYTTEPNPKSPKAVMVFIHGGGFLTGSGSTDYHSPDYLIDYDVVLVTLNYRLHVLGFLNLGIQDCPGNCGLKDQLMALQWVKENIQKFGGDPNNVTIFGESAGSSSVHWHIISPLSREAGLFHKAIAESGTALNSWAFVHNPEDIAFLIGIRLGFKGNDKSKLLEYMKKQSAEELTNAVFDLYFEGMNFTGGHRPFGFIPSIEANQEDAFITDEPLKLIKSAKPLPVIAGMNDREGLIVIGLASQELLKKYDEDFTLFFRHRFTSVLSSSQISSIAPIVKTHYFRDSAINESTVEYLVNAFSDLICLPLYESFEFVWKSSDSPFYVYEFVFDGELNVYKSIFLQNMQPIKGASHADELGYLFYPWLLLPVPPKFGEPETKVIKNMCSFWSNFAKTGNPTPDTKSEDTKSEDTKSENTKSEDTESDFIWKPSTAKAPRYVRIDKNLKMIDGEVMDKGRTFWQKIIEEARSRK